MQTRIKSVRLALSICLLPALAIFASTPAAHSEQASEESGVASTAASAAVAHASASIIIPASSSLAVPLWLAGSTTAVSALSVAEVGMGSVYLAEDIWDAMENPEGSRPPLDATIAESPIDSDTGSENPDQDPDPRTMMQKDADANLSDPDPGKAIQTGSAD